MTPTFLRDIERVLTLSGSLHFWTDVHDYYDESIALLAAHTQLTGPCPVAESPAKHDLDYRTHFERRTRQEGSTVYRAEFVKKG